jgi:galactose oxidase-like protein
MDSQSRKPDSKITVDHTPLIASPLRPRVTRRQLLKMSLIGVGGLAAAVTGLTQLETLVAAPSTVNRWRQLGLKPSPLPRASAAMAYDAARQKTVLFGGTVAVADPRARIPFSAIADTWSWDGLTWTHLSPPLSPPARSGASLAYHPPTQTLVLFGGADVRGRLLGDTWFWNGRTWSPYRTGGPPERANASMAFDPISGSLILFGGFNGGPLSDTWAWNGKSWRALSPSSSPTGSGAGFAYSAVLSRLIHFGGYGGMGNPDNDGTWAWDGSNWSLLRLSPSPQGRSHPSMAALFGGPIVLFGGWSQASASPLSDTWILTDAWSQITQTPAPSPRRNASFSPDPSSNSLLLFGGDDGRGLMGDTWVWGPS